MKAQKIIKLLLIIGISGIFSLYCRSHEKESADQRFNVTTLANLSGFSGKGQDGDQLLQGIAQDGENLYISDFFKHTILRVNIKTGRATIFSGTYGVAGHRDGNRSLFYRPNGITNHAGFLYVADSWNSVIRQVSLASGQVKTFAGRPGVRGHLDGVADNARLNVPMGIVNDGVSLYVTDAGSSTIRKINLKTRLVETVAGMNGVAGIMDGTGNKAQFNNPKGIATDGKFLYIADTQNGSIRKVEIATGKTITLAGKNSRQGASDGMGSDAGFNNPAGIIFLDGVLYVADTGNSKIRRVDSVSGEVTTIAGKHFHESNCPMVGIYYKLISSSPKVVEGDKADGKGRMSRFKNPYGIATDGKRLFVLDTGNRSIRLIEQF